MKCNKYNLPRAGKFYSVGSANTLQTMILQSGIVETYKHIYKKNMTNQQH